MKDKAGLGRVVLATVAGLGALFLAYNFFVAPLQSYNQQITALNGEIADKELEVARAQALRRKIQEWRKESLPPPGPGGAIESVRGEYLRYLNDLFLQAKITPSRLDPSNVAVSDRGPGGKKMVYRPVLVNAEFQTGLANLADLLRRFQHTPLVQKVKSISISREEADVQPGKGKKDEVHVRLQLEALAVEGADAAQPTLQPHLAGADGHFVELDALSTLGRRPAWLTLLSQVGRPRNYAQLAQRDIFAGQRPSAGPGRPVNVNRYVYLSQISEVDGKKEAFLSDRWNNHKSITLTTSPGHNLLRVMDGEKELFQGEVVRIDRGGVRIRVRWGDIDVNVGEDLATAMRRSRRRAFDEMAGF
jgi:hypothetical protein